MGLVKRWFPAAAETRSCCWRSPFNSPQSRVAFRGHGSALPFGFLSSSAILPLMGKKKKVFKALFPWGEASLVRNVGAELSSNHAEPAAGLVLPGSPTGSVPVPPCPQVWGGGGSEPGRCFRQLFASRRLWPLPSPSARLTTTSCPRICLCPLDAAPRPALPSPAFGAIGGFGDSRSGWQRRGTPSHSLPPGRRRTADVEKDAATLAPVSTSHSFHWRVKISNVFF